MANSRILIAAAILDDLDAIVDVHTRARSAYYRAGGLSETEFDAPDGPELRRAGWAHSIESDGRTVLCAFGSGQVVGIVAMGPPLTPDTDAARVGELYQIHVLPGHWGQGIGSQLHVAFVQFLRESSRTTGQVEAWERNHRAQTFYARRGWRPDGRRRPGPGHAGYVRLRLDLAAPAQR